jgi:DUF4097 and DUF4098 domain-containing protein YvlB
MHRTLSRSALVAVLLMPLAARAQAVVGRSDSIYTWRGPLPSGALLSIRNHNGPIDVRAADGGTAELRAVKRTRNGGRIDDVGFNVETSRNGDVTVCSVLRGDDSCDDEGRRSGWNDDRGWVSVSMTVLVPSGGRVRVSTGNGAVTVENVNGEVQAATGNGRVRVAGTGGPVGATTGNGDVEVRDARAGVRVTTGNGRVNVTTAAGPVEARSGNGDIDVQIGAVRSGENMAFHTGSGAVRVTLPAGYNGELDASTGNGELRSDFDLTVKGRLDPRRIRATIGDGGPTLRLTTGNGRLEVRKGQD